MLRLSARSWSFMAILLLVMLTSWAVREASHLRMEFAEDTPLAGQWFSTDPDGLYHLRRIERFRQEIGLPASTDPALNYPHGASVPWPPYYTLVASALTPDDGGRLALEQSASELPLRFAVLTTFLAAFAGALLGGRRGALLAGLMHAFNYGSVHYSTPGVADHHAWVSLLATALVVMFSVAARHRLFLRGRMAALFGALCGTIAGLLLGSWVGAVLYVLPLQLTLGWWLWIKRDVEWRGLALFGLGFHLLAAVALGPAVLTSPWRLDHPWMVVNLSWFHLAWLGLGALVFLPPLWLRSARARARYPWSLLATGVVLAGLLLLLDIGPGPGIREGFSWASRADQFMSSIAESSPLWGTDLHQSGGFARWIGFGVLLLPAALWSAWRAIRGGRHDLIPYFLAVPLLALQAFTQRRFADPLAAPLAILVAWWIVLCWNRLRLPSRNGNLQLGSAMLLALLLQAPSAIHAWQRADDGRIDDIKSAERMLFEWLGRHQDARPEDLSRIDPSEPPPRSVLAAWDFGHVIEWAARRPSIATNFGTYIGVDSFRDPARFLLSEDPQSAEGILDQRRVRYVVLTSRFPELLPTLVKAHGEGVALRDFQEESGRQAAIMRPRWFRSMGAMLFGIGDYDGPDGPARPLPFLRMIHMSPLVIPAPEQFGGRAAAGVIWERVQGAELVRRVGVGKELEVEVSFELKDHRGRVLFRGRWKDRIAADETGFARLRVPYCTGSNGDNWVSGVLWGTEGNLEVVEVPEQAVLLGHSIVKME